MTLSKVTATGLSKHFPPIIKSLVRYFKKLITQSDSEIPTNHNDFSKMFSIIKGQVDS